MNNAPKTEKRSPEKWNKAAEILGIKYNDF